MKVLVHFLVFVCAVSWVSAEGLPLETVVQTGHAASVFMITFSPDSRYLASSGGEDRSIIIWDAVSGRQLRMYIAHTDVIRSLAFAPSGHLLTASQDGTIRMTEIATGRELMCIRDELGQYPYLMVSPDGRYIVCRNNRLYGFWELASGRKAELSDSERDAVLRAMTYSPDGKCMRFRSDRKGADAWETGPGVRVSAQEKGVRLHAAVMNPNGTMIATGEKQQIRFWNAADGALVRTIGGFKKQPYNLVFSPDGRYLAATEGSAEGIVLVDTATGETVQRLGGHTKAVYAVAFSPDGTRIASASGDQSVRLWDTATGTLIGTLGGSVHAVSGIALSPDGKRLAMAGGWWDGVVRVLDFDGRSRGRKPDCTFRRAQDVIWSADGRRIAVTGEHRDGVTLLDAATLAAAGRITYEPYITSTAVSADAGIVCTSSMQDGLVVWDTLTGQRKHTIKDFGHAAALSADGKLIAAGIYGRVGIFDAASGTLVRDMEEANETVHELVFGRGTILAAACGEYNDVPGITAVWDTETGKCLWSHVSETDGVYSIAVSPDGTLAASGDENGLVTVFDARSGAVRAVCRGHRGTVSSAVFSPDGRFLFTAGADDTTIRIWEPLEGRELGLLVFVGEADWLFKTPDGRFDRSDPSVDCVHFVRGMEVFTLDQFFEDFYCPGLLAEVLAGGNAGRPEVSVARKITDSPPPTVTITSPAAGERLERRSVDVVVKVTDTGGGIVEVRLLHNGKVVAGDTRGIKQVRKEDVDNVVTRTCTVTLVPGINTFLASAFSTGRVESRAYRLDVMFQGTGQTAASYVVAVGINQYRNRQLCLNYARPDAEAFSGLISRRSAKLFNDVLVKNLYDEEATREGVLAALDAVAAVAQPEDVFTFYYAGHGSIVDDRYYLITTENVKLYDADKLSENAIYIGDLQEKLKLIKALKQLIVMDACQSGAAVETFAVRGASEEKALAQLARAAGVHVLASAGSQQYASEFKDLGHGVFTYVLLKALEGAADGAPQDGKVTVNELKAYIDDQVPELTEKYKGEAQWPTVQSRGQDFPLVLE